MKRLRNVLLVMYASVPMVAYAGTPKEEACMGATGNTDCSLPTGAKALVGDGGILPLVSKLLIFLVGAISVVMIIIGGLRYVLSGGDPSGTKSAKDTILYALIGLVVSLVAYGIVAWVIGRLSAAT